MAKQEPEKKQQKEPRKKQQEPQKGAQKKPQKKQQKKQQDDRGLVIACVVIVVAVAALLLVFVGRELLGAGSADQETLPTETAAGTEAGAEGEPEESTAAAEEQGTSEAAEESGTAAEEQETSEAAEGTGAESSGSETEAAGETAIPGPVYADITIEGYGTVTVELDASAAPVTVDNFITLAESGFYDGLTFHRIIDGFMMQGGDPEGTGLGGSEKTIVGEFSANGHDNPLSHTRGTISMARSSQDYDSASSQFFIVQSDSPNLDGQYAAFGHVTSGMEYVDQICEDAEPTDNNGSIAPEDQPVITSVVIWRGEDSRPAD